MTEQQGSSNNSGGSGSGDGNGDQGQGSGDSQGQGQGAGDQSKDNAPLGEGGKRALDAERDARQAADRRANELQRELDALKQAKADDGKPEWEQRFNELQRNFEAEKTAREAAEANAEAARLEQRRSALADKRDGFPAGMKGRIGGTTDEEINADIEDIMASIGPRRPEPNGNQGGTRNGGDAQPSTVAAGAELYERLNPKSK